MRTLANWLIAIFMFMYWGFRIVVTYMYSTGKEFLATPMEIRTEIGILFITIFCIFFVIKRKQWAGLIYAIAYIAYFGTDLFKNITTMLGNDVGLSIESATQLMSSGVAVILAILVMIDLLGDKTKRPDDKKTTWFYGNKKFDRQLDEREDRNNYRLH